MTLQAERFTIPDLRRLANACHDLAARYLVRYIDATDLRDKEAASAAWGRYQQYWQAELLAITTDEVGLQQLPSALRDLLENPATAREVADIAGHTLPV